MKNDTAVRYTAAGGGRWAAGGGRRAVGSGRILFVRNDNLYSQKLNRKGRKLDGDAEPVHERVAWLPGAQVGRADFSVSRSGVMPGVLERPRSLK